MNNTDSRKVAIVTGAAVRIGACTARALHKVGFNVLVHYQNSATEATQLVDALNGIHPDSAIAVQAQLHDAGSENRLVDTAVDHWRRLDLLVNNASGFYPTPLGDFALEDLQRLFAVNAFAPLLLSQAALPHLQKQSGCIVNIIDIYGEIVHPDHSIYCASKAALAMITRSLAVECAPSVRVNGVSPGAILWPEGEATLSEVQKKTVLDKIPLARKGGAEDIANAVLYFAEANVTGQILKIDGGRSL